MCMTPICINRSLQTLIHAVRRAPHPVKYRWVSTWFLDLSFQNIHVRGSCTFNSLKNASTAFFGQAPSRQWWGHSFSRVTLHGVGSDGWVTRLCDINVCCQCSWRVNGCGTSDSLSFPFWRAAYLDHGDFLFVPQSRGRFFLSPRFH